MGKKKLLFTGCTAILVCSSFGTSILADYQSDTKNSMDVEMMVDDNGQVVYEYIDEEGVTRTSTTTSSISLTQARFDNIYSINKWDSDRIVVTVKEVPESGAKTSFEIVGSDGTTIASSNGKRYGKGSSWSAKSGGGWGKSHHVRANPSVSGKYKFHLQW